MSERNQDIVEQVSRAERDLLEFKNSQIFGKDVTRPKVIQRYNSDGQPTEYDIVGTFVSNYPGDVMYRVGGFITYTARTQESPWASVYVKIRVNPGNEIVSSYSVGFSAYPDYDQIFAGGKTIKFEASGSSSPLFGPPSDPTVDRFWAKVYVLATDYGTMKLDFPGGNFGNGTVVPLT